MFIFVAFEKCKSESFLSDFEKLRLSLPSDYWYFKFSAPKGVICGRLMSLVFNLVAWPFCKCDKKL